ncbi:hypothetical protein LIER_15689 [Lithospermum erythrorhizon]|uniref:Uncharacterized protein n=1 Tax=Lithospermum erythrorhizon TaxID=34254 RepID=A0AAV3Q3W4_LITER
MEVYTDTARVTYYDEIANEQGLRLNLDLLERKRAVVFLVGDLVLRAKQASPHGKPGTMESPRDGPHIIPRIVGPITYGLETLEGRQVSRTWNACHIRKCYL